MNNKKTIRFMMIMVAMICSAFFSSQFLYGKPVDNVSFQVFRKKLLNACKIRDKKFILDHIDSMIIVQTDGSYNKNDFEKHYLNDPETWNVMELILSHGSQSNDSECKNSALKDYSAAGLCYNAVKVRDGTQVKLQPNSQSRIISILRKHEFITALKSPHKGYTKIITPNGQIGYIQDQDIVDAHLYCAEFKQTNRKWLMYCLSFGSAE